LMRLWWLIHKDLVSEWRARRVWPAMLLLGVVVAVVVTAQVQQAEQQAGLMAGLYWIAVYFAGVLALDRSLASEREEGCWDGLMSYPLGPAWVYVAKLAANTLALLILQGLLLPAFAALSGVPLLARPGAMLLVAALGALGISAVGTLLSAVTAGLRQTAGLLGLLTLPLIVPVLLAATEATRLLAQPGTGESAATAMQFLVAYAVVAVTAGVLLFEFAIEE